MSMLIPTTKRLAMFLTLGLSAAGAYAEESTWLNGSNKEWVVEVTAVGKGMVELNPVFPANGHQVVLKHVGDSVKLTAGSIWKCQYRDAPSTLTSKKEERVLNMSFKLVGPDKRPFRIRAYRSVSPDSNVWVGCDSAAMWDQEEMSSRFMFNCATPGDLFLTAKAVAAPGSLIEPW
jgi:hypothetical protein